MAQERRQKKGSPPRVRGKGYQYDNLTRELGITPARAGKSLADLGIVYQGRDHPRACGEKILPG